MKTLKVKTLKIIALLILALFALAIIGQVLPRPTPPAVGKIVSLPSGVSINTYQKGVGQTIVLTHGLPGSAHDWPELVDALVARGFHVVWYDRVGYGHSSRRSAGDPHTMRVNGQELDALIAAMGLDHPALVGWSFGGGTVQASQAARQTETPFIVLLAAVAPTMSMENRPVNPPGASVIMRLPLIGKIITKAMISARFNDPVPARWMKSARSILLMKGSLKTMDTEMAQLDPKDLHPEEIHLPALIIHGRKDKLVPYDVGVKLTKSLPNGTLMTLDEAGHMLPMTYPEKVANAIKSFADTHTKTTR
ncbi:MAG: alpha/beta hydrolase [Robiginitomaculum sp.]|nr:alpha/beta hydrolase [Robiginitomaculum sp.]